LDLSASTNPTLSFSVANARYNATYYDSLIVWITSDCGGTWTRLASYGNNTGSSPLATAPDVTTAFIPTAAQWATKTLSLSSYATQTAVRVRFQMRSGWGNVTFLDDINVSSSLVGPPTSSFNTSSTTICEGQNINFTNTSVDATSVSWSFPGGSPGSSTQNNPSVIFNNPGTYTVVLTATNTNGTSTSSATITVNTSPNAQVSNVGTICQGSIATIAATGGSSFQWSTGASGNSITVSPSASTTYTVTVTGVNGCTSTAMTTVNVVNCSSLNDLSNSDALMLYPNPVTNYFTLQLPFAYDNDLTVEILTPFGQSIQTNTWFANQTTMIVNTDNFASGLYLVRISDGKQSVLKRIVVVQ
jgi:PKD repeat protein